MEKTIKLSDIRKLYHIERLQPHKESLWSMFKKFGFACLGIFLFFVIIKIARHLWKYLQKFQVNSHQRMNLVELRHVFENF